MNARHKKLFGILIICACVLGFRCWGAVSSFVVEPAASTNLVGVTLELSVFQMADTNYPPLTYRWFKDGKLLADGTHIIGSTSDRLLIENARLEEGGVYSVQVLALNVQISTATSQVHILDVPVVQRIRQENAGAGVRLVAEATGGLLSYQWFWQGQAIAGGTGRTLSFGNPYLEANAGYYTVRVTNIVGEGISPGPGFLLTKSMPGGDFEGLFYSEDGISDDTSGFIQFSLSGSKRSFSGKLWMGTRSYPFSGKFDPTQEASTTVTRKGDRSLDLHLQLLTTNNDNKCIGTLTDGAWESLVEGNQVYYSKANPTTLAKNYTLALVNTNDSLSAPNGTGFARAVVTPDGKAAISGLSATGVSMSQSRRMARNGTLPFYWVGDKGRERIIGWVKINGQGTSSITGESLVWTRSSVPGTPYSDSFALALSAAGSPWPNSSAGVMPFMAGTVALFGGELTSDENPLGEFVQVRSKDGLTFSAGSQTPEKIKFAINRKTGMLSGTIKDLSTGAKFQLRGAALPQQSRAYGFFGKARSGNFVLTP